MASLKQLEDDFNNVIKPQLEEILRLLKGKQVEDLSQDRLEIVAAKIISEVKTTIHDCCKRPLEASNPSTQVIIQNDAPTILEGPWKYSYPNFEVGNEQLGYGKSPNSLTWPIRKNQPES